MFNVPVCMYVVRECLSCFNFPPAFYSGPEAFHHANQSYYNKCVQVCAQMCFTVDFVSPYFVTCKRTIRKYLRCCITSRSDNVNKFLEKYRLS